MNHPRFCVYTRLDDRKWWHYCCYSHLLVVATHDADWYFETLRCQAAVLETDGSQPPQDKLIPSFDDFAYRVFPVEEEKEAVHV